VNRVRVLIGSGKGANDTSVGWQVILCDLIWHVSSRVMVRLVANCYIHLPLPLPLHVRTKSQMPLITLPCIGMGNNVDIMVLLDVANDGYVDGVNGGDR